MAERRTGLSRRRRRGGGRTGRHDLDLGVGGRLLVGRLRRHRWVGVGDETGPRLAGGLDIAQPVAGDLLAGSGGYLAAGAGARERTGGPGGAPYAPTGRWGATRGKAQNGIGEAKAMVWRYESPRDVGASAVTRSPLATVGTRVTSTAPPSATATAESAYSGHRARGTEPAVGA